MPTALSQARRQQATLLQLAFVMGLASHADVIAWADAAILAMEQATEELTLLALADPLRPKVVFGLLGRLAAEANQKLAEQQALGALRAQFRAGCLNIGETMCALRTYREFSSCYEPLLYILDDEYELGLMGYPNSPRMVTKTVIDFLDAHADDSFDPALFTEPAACVEIGTLAIAPDQ